MCPGQLHSVRSRGGGHGVGPHGHLQAGDSGNAEDSAGSARMAGVLSPSLLADLCPL